MFSKEMRSPAFCLKRVQGAIWRRIRSLHDAVVEQIPQELRRGDGGRALFFATICWQKPNSMLLVFYEQNRARASRGRRQAWAL